MPLAAPDIPQTEAVIIEMTNTFRAQNQLSAVAPSAVLQIAAQAFADFLARSGSFAHTADGRQPAERAKAAGYNYCIVAENLALHQSNRGFETFDLAERAVTGWKNSPAHRANLLQPHVTETGIGIAKAGDADPKYLTVQLFGRPGSYKYSIGIENISGSTVSYRLGEQKNTINDAMHLTHIACVPHELTFDIGKVTSKFQAHNGDTFIIARGSDGKPRVELQQSHSAEPQTAGTTLAGAIQTGSLQPSSTQQTMALVPARPVKPAR
jgi:Cysteine-rich secretory protein family